MPDGVSLFCCWSSAMTVYRQLCSWVSFRIPTVPPTTGTEACIPAP